MKERYAFEEGQVLRREGKLRQALDLFAQRVQIGAQVLFVAATELPLHLGVGVVVQHRLHHAQLVEIGIQQVLHDPPGKCAVAHARLIAGFEPAV